MSQKNEQFCLMLQRQMQNNYKETKNTYKELQNDYKVKDNYEETQTTKEKKN